MPRPSVKARRAGEILDAFERCVVRMGVEGASLQAVADEAGLARSLLRHHVGNREDLLAALIERFATRGEAQAAEFETWLPSEGRPIAIVELLFDARYRTSQHEALLYQALLVAAQTRPELREVLRHWYGEYCEALRSEIHAAYPAASQAMINAAAVGILALYFNADSMSAIADNNDGLFADSKLAALKLLEML